MRRLTLIACLVLVAVAAAPGRPAAVQAGNADAAHACQNGGYASLTDEAGNPFKNAGQCTAHAARGGDIIGAGPACSFAPNNGCVVLDDVAITEATFSGGVYTYGTDTYTLAGTMTFTPTCQNGTTGCSYAHPNVVITGTGTFSVAGSTTASGTWTVAYLGAPSPYSFTDGSFAATTCATAQIRSIQVWMYLTSTGSATGGGWLQVRTDATDSGPTKDFVRGDFSSGPLPTGTFHTGNMTGVTISC